ncbi:hypothetical protein ASZ78_011993 [Callipepla squamata]|uniref:Protein-tyrosine-phosphatase n=1 Tax=Callipepla squamata TaxID=9009 RepID=A0A226N1G4_CALSU|nr:hypothetical protein ASZ78_011993 [Callipepla squamata]
MEIDKSNSAYAAQHEHLSLIQRLSRSENVLYGTNLENLTAGMMSKSCDNLSVETNNRTRDKSNLGRSTSGLSQSEMHINLNGKQRSYDYLSIHSTQNTISAPGSPAIQKEVLLSGLEREIICVSLKRDAKNGFGFVIIGGENVGKLDLGIFIASIIPGGPADRAGNIKPGGRLISVNNISLEGVSFNTAVKIIQNSPDEVELIISQPKGDRLLEVDGISLCGLTHKQAVENLKKSGQIAKLVLERGHHQAAEPCLSTNDRKDDQGAVVSVATSFTDSSKDYCFLTDGNTFEVKLTKNSGGLGFSVLQMEEDGYEHLGGAIVRIKRLFPGQPAEENGEIEVGDIILAVNGKPLQGLLYQTPAPSPVKAFMAEVLGCPEAGNSLDPSTSDGGSTSQDLEDCLDSPLAADFSEPPEEESSTYEEQEAEPQENPIQRLMPPRESSYKDLWKFHQEAASSEEFHSLEEEVEQNCYSPCELGCAENKLRTSESQIPVNAKLQYQEMEIFVTLTRSENNGYGFSVVLNKVDNCLYVDEILHEPALSDGRLRRGDRIIMVNGIDVTSLQCNEALSLLQSSPPDLRLVVGRAGSNPCPSVRPDDIPEITLTKGANGQLEEHLKETNNGAQQTIPNSPECKDFIIKIELEKAENGSLGFALVGGRNGRAILIKAISPDSIADIDGRLQVGDILLKGPESTQCSSMQGQLVGQDYRGIISNISDETFVSEDELTHLINYKSSPTEVRPRTDIRHFIQGLKSRIENQEVLKEFMALEHLKPIDDCRTGKAPENRGKNRYQDILPYDKTRVPLGESNGYINASYVRMKVGEEEHFYIITQGPLPSTMADFWQMVWESESDLIAMMTKEVELGNVKSHRYWPEPPQDSIDLANFHLRLDSYQTLEYFIIRIIEMINKQFDIKHIVRDLREQRFGMIQNKDLNPTTGRSIGSRLDFMALINNKIYCDSKNTNTISIAQRELGNTATYGVKRNNVHVAPCSMRISQGHTEWSYSLVPRQADTSHKMTQTEGQTLHILCEPVKMGLVESSNPPESVLCSCGQPSWELDMSANVTQMLIYSYMKFSWIFSKAAWLSSSHVAFYKGLEDAY